VGWKLGYVPVPDPLQQGSFTTSLVVQRIPIPVNADFERSFVQLSLSAASGVDDEISISEEPTSNILSQDVEDVDDEYVVIQVPNNLVSRPTERRDSVAMERGNGCKSPSPSDIMDMNPERATEPSQAAPGTDSAPQTAVGSLIKLCKSMYVPDQEWLRESFKDAGEFLTGDELDDSTFAKILRKWRGFLDDGSCV